MTTQSRPRYPVLDGHNDLAWAVREKHGYDFTGFATGIPDLHTDLPRLKQGGVSAQFWSLWVDPVLEGAEQVVATLEQIDAVHRLISQHPHSLALARTATEARDAMSTGKIASLLGIEGGAQLGGSLAVLRQYARLGARYMTLTWSRTHEWADSATDKAQHNGLSDFGRDVVREMERIGVVPDLAHVSTATMRDTLDTVNGPVFVTHSGAAALCPHPRNVPDDVLQRIGEGGGTVMVAFVPSFLSSARMEWVRAGEVGKAPPVTVKDVCDHICHVREVAGVKAVGLGADYDGTDAMPEGLEDVSGYQRIFTELTERGWSEEELRGLAYANVLHTLAAHDSAYLRALGEEDPPASQPDPALLHPVVDTTMREGHA